ncbi:hypothetical protein [Flocculibacter collagenilyticus]|uniref:hypothetical protein n=1 Tax=Flocculibacter collagenilyticus TaxID=2744479 RepID=UPI0018F45EE1|nr:hypothetical protein [Flocculibacter collagenilyticus]
MIKSIIYWLLGMLLIVCNVALAAEQQNNAAVQKDKLIAMQVEVYSVENYDFKKTLEQNTKNAVLESKPKLVFNWDAGAAIQVGNNEQGDTKSLTRIHIIPEQESNDYVLKVMMNDNGMERISEVRSSIGTKFFMTTSIKGNNKIIVVTTKNFEPNEPAK